VVAAGFRPGRGQGLRAAVKKSVGDFLEKEYV
jgi:hypothetical protein